MPTPPVPPFFRRESPASSTGDSSSGKAPYTPRDGGSVVSAVTRGGQGQGHGGRRSIAFEDEQGGTGTVRGRDNNKGVVGAGGKGKAREKEIQDEEKDREARRRERRRGEARAAIELGKVVNGPPPIDPDDISLGAQIPGVPGGLNLNAAGGAGGVWPGGGMPQFPGMQMQMQMPMMQMQMPMMQMQMPMMPMPSPANADPAYIAAHQQAMAIAKQTFQMAVTQQALAAANEEWERGSAMTSMTGMNPGVMMGGMGGMGMNPWMGGGMGGNVMFPSGPRSMYAGSTIGMGGGGGGGWGSQSVYGIPTGPAVGMRQGQGRGVGAGSEYGGGAGARPGGGRVRTKTAPSSGTPPHANGSGQQSRLTQGPPSSYRAAR
ncbi:hypothetical protein M422DRAFT_241673 [Sphaerobolus stellatus SS14]|nr:hypothetical protein M422DRAFT_241673 [Sphaerobolus stellatus SS14]